MQPQGFVHAPQDIAVGPVGYLNSPRGSVISPTEVSIGKTITDLTPPKPPAATRGGFGRKRELLAAASEEQERAGALAAAGDAAAAASDAAAAATFAAATGSSTKEKKIVVSDDPLDLSRDFPHDYRNWAAVLSQVLMTKEGSEGAARDSLRRLMLSAHGHLAKVASGEEFLPRFHLQDPVLSAASSSSPFPRLPFFGGKGKADAPPSAFPATSVTAFSSSATFFNYAPCVLSETPTGASASITGLNFIPSLFSISALGFEADTAIVNLQPQLIYLAAKANSVSDCGERGRREREKKERV